MYILRLEYQVAVGQRGAFEASQTQLYDLVVKQPGFVRSTLVNSLAYPSKYQRISLWESRAALLDFWKSGESGAFGPAPATPVAPAAVRGYEDVEIVRPAENNQYLGMAEIEIALGMGPAFEERGKAFAALIRREGRGVALTALVRQAGGGRQYVLALGFLTQEDATTTLTSAAITQFQQTNPLSQFGANILSQEGSAVVQVAVAARVAASA